MYEYSEETMQQKDYFMHSQNAESMFGFIPFKSLHLNEKKKYKKKIK